jgi:hypothetical protein
VFVKLHSDKFAGKMQAPRNAAERGKETTMGKDGRDAVRVTTTLTRQQHAELERLAQQHGVKVAWLLRRATERLIEQANDGSSFPLNFGQEDNHA